MAGRPYLYVLNFSTRTYFGYFSARSAELANGPLALRQNMDDGDRKSKHRMMPMVASCDDQLRAVRRAHARHTHQHFADPCLLSFLVCAEYLHPVSARDYGSSVSCDAPHTKEIGSVHPAPRRFTDGSTLQTSPWVHAERLD